ncbi:MAG: hypothetical protein KDD89_12765 [Anaerolineales bacterium]|nr:hypothetical protein [Anaerolineales bacterium]
MISMTMTLPDELAERIRPISTWVPTILELSLLGFQTRAAATANEVIQFLATNPTIEEVLRYHISEAAQQRLQRLLTLNANGMISEEEQCELDELEALEHVMIMLKSRITP